MSFRFRRADAFAAALALLLAASCGFRARTGAPSGDGAPLDVVLVTIDTLRADAPGYAGNRKVATPVLDALAREGAVFTRAYAHAVVTLPSHASILTGLYPRDHRIHDNEGFRLEAGIPTLATWLKERGYATGAFIGGFPLDSRFGLARGFDVYDQKYPLGEGVATFVLPERRAADVVSAALAWYRGAKAKGPRFLWVHLYDCHAPYRPPPPFDRTYAADPYLGEVAGVDAALAPLVASLDRERTLLAVTSDHGESLGEHGEVSHGLFAYEATLHVPLLLWSPGRLAKRTDATPARHVDLAPTLLAAAGIRPPESLPGQSLLPSSRAARDCPFEALTAALTRGWAPLYGIVSGRWKWIDLPVPELYDLEADPAETKNLVADRPDVVRTLAAALSADRSDPARTASSGEAAAKLRSLGYLGGRSAWKGRWGPEDDPKALVPLDAKINALAGLYDARRLPEAEAVARELVAARPSMPAGWEYLSLVQAERGNVRGAAATLEEASQKDLLDDRLRSRLALLLSETGDARGAASVADALASSRDLDALNAVGIVRARAGNVRGAQEAFQAALKIEPEDATTWQNIAITAVRAGRFEEGGNAADRALASNDRLPRAWNARGIAAAERGDTAGALAAWERAVVLDPGQLETWLNMADVARRGGRRDIQARALSEFVARAPAGPYAADLARARAELQQVKGNP